MVVSTLNTIYMIRYTLKWYNTLKCNFLGEKYNKTYDTTSHKAISAIEWPKGDWGKRQSEFREFIEIPFSKFLSYARKTEIEKVHIQRRKTLKWLLTITLKRNQFIALQPEHQWICKRIRRLRCTGV